MPRAFVIRPFGNDKTDSKGKVLDFERVQTDLITPALAAAKLDGTTTSEIVDAGNIREDMFSLILEADLVIADVTIHNANVFYELGIRHALRKRRTILIKGRPVADAAPFDLLTDRYCAYNIDKPAESLPDLIATVTATLRSDRETDSPIFQMLPTLAEADPEDVQIVPVDFREEVERARAAQSKGWLRLLAEDVIGRRFQWVGLKLIAKAQWDIGDYEGARKSYELIRDMYPNDVDANLAQANLYERQYRKKRDPDLLAKSDQALQRVLESKKAHTGHRVEALALKGRNQKTRWRLDFEGLDTMEARREAAMNESLRDSYEAYRDAFYQDLNHFYSGLAALQMGSIFLDLSADEAGAWTTTFETDDEAKVYRQGVEKAVAQLRLIVRASVEAALKRMSATDPERVWADISLADVMFLTESSTQRIANKYKASIPKDKPFAWDAAKGQLELFAGLGVRGEIAQQVIALVDVKQQPKQPLHVIVFVGHRVDAPDREEPRFPSAAADKARQLIRESLSQLGEEHTFVAMASAAPGADLLFHEVCAELKLKSTLCLPMPSEDYARETFKEFDDWRSRYLELMRKEWPVLTLSDRVGLPKWLDGAKTDPWERGNRWVLQMALTSGADKISLFALWDNKDEGDARGGTADMVRLARESGQVDVSVIDARQLLS